jgi:hypothetical protein
MNASNTATKAASVRTPICELVNFQKNVLI